MKLNRYRIWVAGLSYDVQAIDEECAIILAQALAIKDARPHNITKVIKWNDRGTPEYTKKDF